MHCFRKTVWPPITLAFLCTIVLPGCGSETATVTGVVTFQGKPVPGGSVVFYCADKQIVRGLIGTDGRYTIPNVPCGQATVTVQSPSRLPAGMRIRQQLPPVQNGPTIPTAEGSDSSGKGAGIPPRYALPDESGLVVVVPRGQLVFDIELHP
jgi:hypothetical protein